eukprot:scaffold2621_cov124-Isochrysis_galbana.AAC.3
MAEAGIAEQRVIAVIVILVVCHRGPNDRTAACCRGGFIHCRFGVLFSVASVWWFFFLSLRCSFFCRFGVFFWSLLVRLGWSPGDGRFGVLARTAPHRYESRGTRVGVNGSRRSRRPP